jgi:hypothetical protein
MTDSPPEPTAVALAPIRSAIQELAFAGVLVAMGWGVVRLIEWAERAPAWVALIFVTLGREGVFAAFAMFAVFVALAAPGHLAEGGWRRSANVLRLLVLAAIVIQVVDWFATGHTFLGVAGAVFAALIALILRRDARTEPVPRAAVRRGAG